MVINAIITSGSAASSHVCYKRKNYTGLQKNTTNIQKYRYKR